MSNPWYKTSFQYSALGKALSVDVPHDVFSTRQIDEGTLLLLDHLPPASPSSEPKTILDMGCGYGALGLPIAARFSRATVDMVDRDLLAVKFCAENAKKNNLLNARVYGSLGFRDLCAQGSQEAEARFDWILCNVPARIGNPFIQDLIESGASRLNANGELRVVVINDLSPILLEMKSQYNWPLKEIAVGPRHTIFSISAIAMEVPALSSEELYFRDHVNVQDLELARPFDLGGDDQKRLKTGLPVLIDMLPRQLKLSTSNRILCFRSGYGAIPLLSRKRWPEAQVVAVDRDLLGTTFTKLNADTLGLSDCLEVRESAFFPDAIAEGESFDLILGELSPSAGEEIAHAELRAIETKLAPKGQAILLCHEKTEKEWLRQYKAGKNIKFEKALGREGYAVMRMEVRSTQ